MTPRRERVTGRTGPVFDDRLLCALLLHADAPEDVGGDAARRYLRTGLAVAALSGMTLAPAVSLADDAPPAAPTVTVSCEITDALSDGTPSGVLADGSVCVLPPAVSTIESSPPRAPADAPSGDGAEHGQPAAEASPEPDANQAADARADPSAAQTPPAVELASRGDAGHGESASKLVVPRRTKDAAKEPAAHARHTVAAEPVRHGPRRSAQRKRQHQKHAREHRHAQRSVPAPAPAQLVPPTPVLDPGAVPAPFYVTDEPVIPRFLIKLYKKAGRRYHVPWPILAAINEIETDFGRNVAVSSAGATGWMQFMPATWDAYGVDADHDGVKDPNDPRDAIFAAARYLKASGARHHMRRAIFAYNHAGWYVDSILLRAERIAAHQGERNRRLDRLFRAGERRLERQVLADPRITLYDCGREDIAAHKIDRRILVLLRFLAWSGLNPTVTSLECGHGLYTTSGNISEHSTGTAVDIAAINGIPIFGNQGSGSVTEATIRELLTLRGAMKPHQIISLMTFDGTDNTLAMADHADHIHVGFRPLADLSD